MVIASSVPLTQSVTESTGILSGGGIMDMFGGGGNPITGESSTKESAKSGATSGTGNTSGKSVTNGEINSVIGGPVSQLFLETWGPSENGGINYKRNPSGSSIKQFLEEPSPVFLIGLLIVAVLVVR